MSNVQNQTITIYLGKGEYALTDKSLPKLIAVVKEYNANGKWIWKMVDFLGVRADGKYTKRFADAKAVLSTIDTADAKELLQLLTDFVPRASVTRTTRNQVAVEVDEFQKALSVAQKEFDAKVAVAV